MGPIVCVIETGAGSNLIRASIPEQSWLDNFNQHEIPEIQSASDRKLATFWTSTLHPFVSESHTQVKFSVVGKQVIPVFLGPNFIDRSIYFIPSARRNFVPHPSPWVPILTLPKTRTVAKKDTSDNGQKWTNTWHYSQFLVCATPKYYRYETCSSKGDVWEARVSLHEGSRSNCDKSSLE